MKIEDFEKLIIGNIQKIIDEIIKNNLVLPISAQARAGAEISDWLEERFVEHTIGHKYFKDTQASPKGSTKNPWDARTVFKLNEHQEEIWIDFKAFKVSGANSNPDIGTPNKIIRLINDGSFYHVFVHVFYRSKEGGLQFVEFDNEYSRVYFLKDISSTFRRNPKNQLQVNISAKPEYRTRKEFIRLLIEKITESHKRQIEISIKALENIGQIAEELYESNNKSEMELIKKIQ